MPGATGTTWDPKADLGGAKEAIAPLFCRNLDRQNYMCLLPHLINFNTCPILPPPFLKSWIRHRDQEITKACMCVPGFYSVAFCAFIPYNHFHHCPAFSLQVVQSDDQPCVLYKQDRAELIYLLIIIAPPIFYEPFN